MNHPALVPEIERLIQKVEERLVSSQVVNDRIIRDKDFIDIHRVLCEARMYLLDELDKSIQGNGDKK